MNKYDMPMEADPSTISGKIMAQIVQGSVVLEFGSANGRMTRYMKEQLQCKVYIVELDNNAFEDAIKFAEDGLCGNIEDFQWLTQFQDISFDYILFADVLEHLYNPQKVLGTSKQLLKENGSILLSIPNIAHADILLNLYANKFEYTSTGLLDNTHIRFWGYEELNPFCTNAGFSIIQEDASYVEPFYTEQRTSPNEIPFELINLLQQKKMTNLYQFFLVLKKSEWAFQKNLKKNSLINVVSQNMLATFYFNTGNGYAQTERISICPKLVYNTNLYEYRCDTIPQNCISVRFDPAERVGCILTNLKILTNNGLAEIVAQNGIALNERIFFLDTDSQIEIKAEQGCRWIQIQCEIQKFTDTVLYELIQEVRNLSTVQATLNKVTLSLDTTEEQNTNLMTQRKELQEGISLLSAKLTETQQEKELFSAKLTETQQEKELFSAKLTKTQQEKELFSAKLTETQQEKELISAELAETQSEKMSILMELDKIQYEKLSSSAEVAEILRKNKSISAELLKVQQESDLAAMQMADANTLLTQKTMELSTIVNSQSWKATKPIRVVLDKVKCTQAGKLLFKAMYYLKHFGVLATMRKTKQYIFKKKNQVYPNLPQSNLLFPQEVTFEIMIEQVLKEKGGNSGKVYLPDQLKSYDKMTDGKFVLLVSHELALTGAPIALHYFAKSLKENGNFPIIISPSDGKLSQEILKDNIPVIIFGALFGSNLIPKCTKLFSFVVTSTIVTYPIINMLAGKDISVMWWIHEAKASYTTDVIANMPANLPQNVQVYCGGEYAKKLLLQYRSNYNPKIFLYYVPDYGLNLPTIPTYVLPGRSGKFVYAVIGMQEERKGQDILVDAILSMDVEDVQKCMFVFIGKQYFANIHKKIMYLRDVYPENTMYIEELNRDELLSFYMQMDCLLCTSRDDPMPIVVTEALLMSKLVICSENTGFTSLIQKTGGGFIYNNNSPQHLIEIIRYVTCNWKNLQDVRNKARLTYEQYFSQDAFCVESKNVLQALNKNANFVNYFNGIISIVIPTYNAGANFFKLISMLQGQKNAGQIEVVIVDSGSADSTVEISKSSGVTLIEIPQCEFSHSYARNLGAETAKGDILVFMTQDAMPTSENWLHNITAPILYEQIVAVSCKEKCPEDTDLYYKIASWNHSHYLGLDKGDITCNRIGCVTNEDIRKNASLNDVTCAVRRSVFLQFKYQHSYAEDLDLGCRLTKSGYSIKILSSEQVIHGHNRTVGYYLRRAIAEANSFQTIFEGIQPIKETSEIVARRIIRGFITATDVVSAMQNAITTDCPVEQFFRRLRADFKKRSTVDITLNAITIGFPFSDKTLDQVVTMLSQYAGKAEPSEYKYTLDLEYYCNYVVAQYIRNEYTILDIPMQQQIYASLFKQFGFMSGGALANIDANPELQDYISGLAKGV